MFNKKCSYRVEVKVFGCKSVTYTIIQTKYQIHLTYTWDLFLTFLIWMEGYAKIAPLCSARTHPLAEDGFSLGSASCSQPLRGHMLDSF